MLNQIHNSTIKITLLRPMLNHIVLNETHYSTTATTLLLHMLNHIIKNIAVPFRLASAHA